MRKGFTAVAGATALAVLVATSITMAPAANAAKTITVWTDPEHAPVIQELTKNGIDGVTVTVVAKDPATVGNELSTVGPDQAPDVLWGNLATTGALADAGLIVPVTLPKKVSGQFRPNVVQAAQVGADNYGVPVQISNLALITNTTLVPNQPTTFAGLSETALKLEKRGKVTIPLAIPQGEGSNGVNLFPLFEGLGGYLFGRGADGGLVATDVGLMNPAFRKNAGQIDGWNASGLIDSTLTPEKAAKAFAKGRSAFWMAGPEDLAALLKLKFVYRIGVLPPVQAGKKSRPLLTVFGFMVTKFAKQHGVADEAAKLVTRRMTKTGAQLKLAEASGWFPAQTTAAAQVQTGGGRIRAIGNAGADGVAMPNIPQAAALWGPYGTAWSASTSGASATPAKKAFRLAKRAVVGATSG